MIRVGLVEIFDHILEQDKGVSRVYTWGKVLCRGSGKCKGPEVGVCCMYLRNIKETNVAGAERVRGEWWEIKSQRKRSGAMKGLSHKVRWETAGRLKC